jgi:hypothetical protein
MFDINNSSRRKFILDMAKAGVLLPFAGQMFGQKAVAGTAYKNILFLYQPNGVQANSWNPVQDTGAITTSGELSFGLGPLQPWHNNIIVFKNIHVDIESGGGGDGGGHKDQVRGCLTGNHRDDGGASIDHLIAEKLGNKGVLSLGVRTGNDSQMKVSKPRNVGTKNRPTPNNNPFDVATKLKAKINPTAVDPLQQKVYAAVLADMATLSSETLIGDRQAKVEQHLVALKNLKDRQQQGTLNIDFDFSQKETLADGESILGKANARELFSQFPALCKAQINNIVAAFANGLHSVATLQLSVGDENTGLANYSFDECWDAVQAARAQIPNATIVGNRWDNEHASHGASHRVDWCQAHAQVRWHSSILAYTLQQLKDKGILDETLVVTISDEGDGAEHNLAKGSIVLAGGANNGLQMGRVINCGNGNQDSRFNGFNKGTHQLFGDIAKLLGAMPSEGSWKNGII